MNRPRTVRTPRQRSMRPANIINPIAAMAMTPTAVAMVPSSVPCTHVSAATRLPSPGASARDAPLIDR